MASALVGALRATLGLDTAAFEQGAKRSITQSQKLAKQLKGILGAVGVGATFAGLIGAFKSVIDHADKLGETAQKIGIPVAELSKLEFAAKLSDVSLETLSGSVAKLSRNMSTVLAGSTGEASRAFQTLGISMADLSKLSPSEALARIASQFASMPDGARKTALAMQLLGRTGFELIPFLNEGASGLQRLLKEANAFGIEISGPVAAASDRFNDNLTRLKAVLEGITTRVVTNTLPAFDALLQRLTDNATGSSLATRAADGFSNLLKGMLGDVIRFETGLGSITRFFSAFQEALTTSGRDLEIWNKALADNAKATAQMQIALDSLRSGKYGGLPAPKPMPPTDSDPLVTTPTKAKPAWEGLSRAISLTDRELGKLPSITTQLADQFDDMGGRLSDVFFDAIEGSRSLADSFKGMANSMLRDVTGLFANRAFQLFVQMLLGPRGVSTGVGPGGLGFTHFGGPRQHGGRVRRGRSFLVGERGPEMFVPRTAGSVVPHGELGSSGGNVQVNIINNTSAEITKTERPGPDGMRIIDARIDERLGKRLPKTMTTQFGIGQRLQRRGS